MRITKATLKSFVKKAIEKKNLYIKTKSSFDGMVDCVIDNDNAIFRKVEEVNFEKEYTWGITGAWMVGNSRDRFEEYEDRKFKGIKIYNCCGSFILASIA